MKFASDTNALFSLRSQGYQSILNTPDARRKAQLFNAMVPASCINILDVGGASGWVTSAMRKDRLIITQDINFPSLSVGSGNLVQSDGQKLPFANKSFDLVLSSQVLEHLPNRTLKAVCLEMARVGKNYLLVSVPYREDLSVRIVRCLNCGITFHPDHHLHSFSERDLEFLFPGWIIAEWHVFGTLSSNTGSNYTKVTKSLRVYLSHALSNSQPPENTVCPGCGQPGSFPPKMAVTINWKTGTRSALRLLLRALGANNRKAVLKGLVTPYWIAALYISQSGPKVVDGQLPLE